MISFYTSIDWKHIALQILYFAYCLQDAVSRKISLETLVDFALTQGSQWIFITPHDIRYGSSLISRFLSGAFLMVFVIVWCHFELGIVNTAFLADLHIFQLIVRP